MAQRRHEAPELGAAARRFMRALAVRATEGDTEAIEQLAGLRDACDEALGQAVAGAREAKGYSWAEVAQLVGTTRQNAQQRWHDATPPEAHRCEHDECGLLFPTEAGRLSHGVRDHGEERCPKTHTPQPQRCVLPAHHVTSGQRHIMGADEPDNETDTFGATA